MERITDHTYVPCPCPVLVATATEHLDTCHAVVMLEGQPNGLCKRRYRDHENAPPKDTYLDEASKRG